MKGKLFNATSKYYKRIEFKDIEELSRLIRGTIQIVDELWITKNTLKKLNDDKYLKAGKPLNPFFCFSVFDKNGSLIRFMNVNIKNSKGNLFKHTEKFVDEVQSRINLKKIK